MRRTFLTLLALAAALSPSPAGAQEITVETDVRYTMDDGQGLGLDVYLPEGSGPHPAVVWIHGGAWRKGDKADPADARIATNIAGHGFAVFSVNYRLAAKGAVGFPAAMEDVRASVRWIRANADRYDVDPARIAAAGNSSGGHLAAVLATLGEGPLDQGSRVRAAVTFSAPTDLSALLAHHNENVTEAIRQFLGCDDEPSCERLAELASPIRHVDGSDAPILLVNATDEVIPIDQATEMRDALRGAGVEARVIEVPGTHHGLGNLSWVKVLRPAGMTLHEIYLEFLGRQLGHEVSVEGPPSAVASTPGASGDKAAAPGQRPAGSKQEGKGRATEPDDTGRTIAIAAAILALAAALLLLRRIRPPRPKGGPPAAPAEERPLAGASPRR